MRALVWLIFAALAAAGIKNASAQGPQQQEAFGKARAACLESKGYSLK